MDRRVDPIEERNDEAHRRVAALIRRDTGIIDEAKARLERSIASEKGPPNPVLLEWRAAFMMLDADELATFLESPTPRAKRMRISTPFLLRPKR